MFEVYDLNKKYQYDYSVRKSLTSVFLSKKFDKRNPHQLVSFINQFVTANKWEWDRVTFHICKRLEYLIQEELPSTITNKKDIYSWIIKSWQK